MFPSEEVCEHKDACQWHSEANDHCKEKAQTQDCEVNLDHDAVHQMITFLSTAKKKGLELLRLREGLKAWAEVMRWADTSMRCTVTMTIIMTCQTSRRAPQAGQGSGVTNWGYCLYVNIKRSSSQTVFQRPVPSEHLQLPAPERTPALRWPGEHLVSDKQNPSRRHGESQEPRVLGEHDIF